MTRRKKPAVYELPDSIRIFGKSFTISRKSLEDGFDNAGEMDESKLTIDILDGQIPIEEADTLLHEVIHAMDYLLDLKLTEEQVRVLATALIGVFQDNRYFTEFVTRQFD